MAVGLFSIGLGLWGLVRWWPLALVLVKAAGPLILLTGGLIAVVAGLAELRDEQKP